MSDDRLFELIDEFFSNENNFSNALTQEVSESWIVEAIEDDEAGFAARQPPTAPKLPPLVRS